MSRHYLNQRYKRSAGSAMNNDNKQIIPQNPWQNLKQFTPARIALGHTGISLPTKASLEFQLAQALAYDAVNVPLDFKRLEHRLNKQGYQCLMLQTRAENQRMYLQRPDLGRLLSESALECFKNIAQINNDVVVVVADGLSSNAIDHHAEPFLKLLLPELQVMGYTLPPLCLVQHGRVAIGDAIAEHFAARLCIVLIGERPGLSSPDSMGIYFTYQAQSGISTDADRNCISNIHNNGLSYVQALQKLLYLIKASESLKISGVNLKEQAAIFELSNQQQNFLLD